ncbi:MAG: hypothetical protein ABH872_03660 [Candidatus Omnitrophota bacterium]
MRVIDFALGWPVEGDNDFFINVLKAECRARRLSFAVIYESALGKLTSLITKDKVKISFFLDMASETFNPKDSFTKFIYCLKDSETKVVADPDYVKFSADKSITHFNLARAKISVPFTVIIRNWEPTRRLTKDEKKGLGFPFVVKPALGYGQKGVKIIKQKFCLKEIAEARQFNPGDNFLLQEFIEPPLLNGTMGWFRVFYLFGEIFPCWWNAKTNVFRQVTLREYEAYKLAPMARIATEIAKITGIEWFSCEIAINEKTRKCVVIDYMNDQCAVYPQSQHKDGIPDDLIVLICRRMVQKAWEYIKGNFVLPCRAVWFPSVKLKDEDS